MVRQRAAASHGLFEFASKKLECNVTMIQNAKYGTETGGCTPQPRQSNENMYEASDPPCTDEPNQQ